MNQQLPIEHLSYSATRTFLTNPWLFRKRYILGLYDFKTSPSMAEGKSCHKYIELRLKGKPVDYALAQAHKLFDTNSDDQIEWGSTQNREKSHKAISQACGFLEAEMPDIGEVLKVEYSATVLPEVDGKKFPLPLKAITDVVTKTPEGIVLHDWKFITKFTDPNTEDPEKIMQAMFNYFCVLMTIGEPAKMIFWEIKKSKNKDEEPQVRPYVIDFSHTQYFRAFGRIYSGIVRQLADENTIFLPNLSDRLTSEEAWEDFMSEVMEFDMPDQVSHRTASTKMVEHRFVESVPVSEDTASSVQDRIISKLMEFGMALEFHEKFSGATLDMYAFKTARGVRMSTVEKYDKDLQQALEVKSVRILAPIPGTKFVGVEVPKKDRISVTLPETTGYNLPVGIDVYGESHSIDLSRTAHILVAGATGAGKSVCLSNFIHTLSKTDAGLVLIDPKRTEFAAFRGLPNLMTEKILTENQEISVTLEWLVDEMEDRYAQLESFGATDINKFNRRGGNMQRIIVVIDELADIMLTSGKVAEKKLVFGEGSVQLQNRPSIESMLTRLAQKSRACGIHLILATQRPSTEIVTGILKANITTRVGFMTATGVDSKVILDQSGAEKLIGMGDCLLMQPGKGLIRCQGYFTPEED